MSILRAELEQNGVADWLPTLMVQDCLLNELDYALSPIVHEGKIRPYGFIALPEDQAQRSPPFDHVFQIEIADARKLSDGCHSFVLFEGGVFQGVLFLEQKIETELQFVNFQQAVQGVVSRTTTEGITQVFCPEGSLLHQLRRWYKKPAVHQIIASLCHYFAEVDTQQLQAILEFCSYELSPQKIGSLLIWYLTPIQPEELQMLLPNARLWRLRKTMKSQVGSVINNAVLQHVLTYTDGAVIIDADGSILGAGAHLKYSLESAQRLPAYKGTRHTSAQRFSYDCPDIIAFVVSSDGSVTIFFKGEIISISETYAASSSGLCSR